MRKGQQQEEEGATHDDAEHAAVAERRRGRSAGYSATSRAALGGATMPMSAHGAHYSAAGWVGGGAGAAALQERWGAGIYYNPLVRVRGRLLKYGVIRAATLRDDRENR